MQRWPLSCGEYPPTTFHGGTITSHFFSLSFVAFIAGSFAAVLVLASVVDPDLFLSFEITPHRTVLFYITVFTSILAVARGMIPEDNNVFDPELLMEEVIGYTHYMPDEWKGQLHSKKVKKALPHITAGFVKLITTHRLLTGSRRIRRAFRHENHGIFD
jgi:autophagy-related protein 9